MDAQGDIKRDEANENLEALCNQVLETGEAIVISQQDGKNVVLISETELNSLLETLYLLRSPTNSARLLTALERAKARIIGSSVLSMLN